MTFFRNLLCLGPAVCLLAQTPPPQSAPPPAPATVQPSGAPPASLPATVRPSTAPRVMPPPPPPPPTVPPDRVVITVGEVKITAAQFDNIISLLPQNSQASARGAGRKQFGDAVVRILALSDEGRRRKLDQTPAFQTQFQFAQNNLLAGATAEQVNKEMKVDETDLRKYYQDHITEFEQAHARHILIRVKGSPSPLPAGHKEYSDTEALAKAQEIKTKIDGGADFAALAKEESDDTGSGASGGDLGTFPHGRMAAAFDQAAFALKPGEISQPVKTQFGYHIIKLESKDAKSFDEVKPDLERRMRPELTQKAVEELVKKANPVLDPEFFATAKK